MRTVIVAAMLGLLASTSLAQAATLAQPAPGPQPRLFSAYGHPPIAASACRTLGVTEAQCVVPAMTAGRYLIEATASSTSQGAGAAQALEIIVGATSCGLGKNTQAWTGARVFRLDCEVTLLADAAVTVRAIYADVKAVKDSKGPTLALRALPWDGVLASRVFAPPQ